MNTAVLIEFTSYFLCVASAYWLYTARPWKKTELYLKMLNLFAFGLVFSPLVGQAASHLYDLFWKPIMMAIIFGVLWAFSLKFLRRFGLQDVKDTDEFKSGVQLCTVAELQALVKNIKGPKGPKIGEVETKSALFSTHGLLIGAPGSGKSLVLRQMIEHAINKNEKMVMLDPGAEFFQYYWDKSKGHRLLNLFDIRAENWSAFSEMRHESDSMRITKSLIPDGLGSSRVWNGYAQTVLDETIKQIFRGHSKWKDSDGGIQKDKWVGTNGELFDRLIVDSNALSAARMDGTGAGKLMQGAGEMVSSFMGIIGQFITPFQSLDRNAGKDSFSIREWIENEDEKGVLWITFNFDDLEFVKPILAMWMDIVSTSILSLPTKLDRKIWVIADEFPVLGAVNSVETLLSNGRKKGANVVLASQTQSQWVATYGENKALNYLGNLRTWCVFSSPELKTREYLANSIGKQEVDRRTFSGGSGKGAGWSKNVAERNVVTASQIKTLEPLHFYLCLPGNLPIVETIAPLPPTSYVKVAEAFVLKGDKNQTYDSYEINDDVIDISALNEAPEGGPSNLVQDESKSSDSSYDEDDMPFNFKDINGIDSDDETISSSQQTKTVTKQIDLDSQTDLIDF